MLKLKSKTSAAWVKTAVENLDAILLDHVHCEKKAAATAMALINRYPDRELLVDHMVALAVEELQHFDRVLKRVQARGLTLKRDVPDVYVNKLLTHVRKNEPDRLLDTLICASLIEARSAERFKLLSTALPNSIEKVMYKDLMASEAGHYLLFLSIAKKYFPVKTVNERFEQIAQAEMDIVASLSNEPHMHG
jgi:tRNA 2-(methylsulfanyl)-N6-isopentenyladenosine37 hydroxylase